MTRTLDSYVTVCHWWQNCRRGVDKRSVVVCTTDPMRMHNLKFNGHICIEKWALTHCDRTVKPTMRERRKNSLTLVYIIFV